MNVGRVAAFTGFTGLAVGGGAAWGASYAKMEDPFPAKNAGEYLSTVVRNGVWGTAMSAAFMAVLAGPLGAARVSPAGGLAGAAFAGVGAATIAAGIASYRAVKD